MKRNEETFEVEDLPMFRDKSLQWASQFSHACLFNSNQIDFPYKPFKNLLAADRHYVVPFHHRNDFDQLRQAVDDVGDWLIGHLGYDLKNQIEPLSSCHFDLTGFADIAFFQPKHLVFFDHRTVTILTPGSPQEVFKHIQSMDLPTARPRLDVPVKGLISRSEYIETVERLKDHILEGDIYEINYCMAFFAEHVELDPAQFYSELVGLSPTPFSSFYKNQDRFALCASPERFLKKTLQKLTSQPIKGTARRGNSSYEDERIKQRLRTDEKELAENMMIVDLVRNDLARSCKPGTVAVDEMFGIYTFKQLHQMISTVSGTLREGVHFVEAIKNAFPMGSMTGAPKVKVMELIEQYEKYKRGLFSGSIGYITPEGDFDFNVVIRTLFYEKSLKRASFAVGSAITYDSNPANEYEECLLKAAAISSLLANK
ncbi:MAG: anthranilate synthase component I family protein [Cytophagales bacterium]|nr:anthranilate synthase component I family protein [Cytophagales bacterium]